MTQIADVLAWKFPGTPGIETLNGKVTRFGSAPIPSKIELDGWTLEYEARDIDEERISQAFDDVGAGTLDKKDRDRIRVLFQVILELVNRVNTLEGGSGNITPAQLKTWLKNKLP